MDEEEYGEWVVCGRLPRKKSGEIDVYKIERAMRTMKPYDRVALLRTVAMASFNPNSITRNI
jgi:hypothetical protein